MWKQYTLGLASKLSLRVVASFARILLNKMTIIDYGDGVYSAGDIDIHVLRGGIQILVDRHANFSWEGTRELAVFLQELIELNKNLK